VYAITPAGRRALRAWLAEPGDGPVLECEQLLKVFFAEHGSKAGLLATLAAAGEWAQRQSGQSLAIGEQYAAGHGPFPERMAELQLTSRFLTDFYLLVGNWAAWATQIVTDWPDDPRQASHDPSVIAETNLRAATGAGHRSLSAAERPPRADGGATSRGHHLVTCPASGAGTLPVTGLTGAGVLPRGWPGGCGRSSMAEPQPSKLVMRVRFPSPAPSQNPS
jgi:hypothetical protein